MYNPREGEREQGIETRKGNGKSKCISNFSQTLTHSLTQSKEARQGQTKRERKTGDPPSKASGCHQKSLLAGVVCSAPGGAHNGLGCREKCLELPSVPTRPSVSE